jgi:O-antigen/teichoic acid export membrane protein
VDVHDEGSMKLMEQQRVQPVQRVDAAVQTRADSSLAESALWLIVAKGAAFALSVAVPLLLVRQLTVREFGIYKQIFLLLDTAVVIFPLGFAMNAFYFFPREQAKRASVVGNIVLVYALVGGLGGMLVAAYPALMAAVLNSRDLVAYAPTIGIAMLLWVASSFVEFVAIANGEAKLAAVVITAMKLLGSALLVAAGGLFGSIRALAYAAVLYGFLQSAVMLWYVTSRFGGAYGQLNWRLMRVQFAYSAPLAYAALLAWLTVTVHHYFVSNRYGPAAYAIYAVGCFQLPIVGIVMESIGSVVIRRVSELRRRDETRMIVHLAARTVRTLAAVALPLCALLLVTGREFITVLFTQRYGASWPIYAVNTILIPLTIIAPACDAVFRACPEHMPFLLKTRTALLVPLLGGLWIATQRFGLVGPIVVVVAVTLAERVAIAIKVARILDMSWSDLGLFRDVAKLGVAAAVAGIATAIVRGVLLGNGFREAPLALLAISAGVFAFVQLGAVVLLRVMTPEERGAIRQWLAHVHQVATRRRPPDTSEQGPREPSV